MATGYDELRDKELFLHAEETGCVVQYSSVRNCLRHHLLGRIYGGGSSKQSREVWHEKCRYTFLFGNESFELRQDHFKIFLKHRWSFILFVPSYTKCIVG